MSSKSGNKAGLANRVIKQALECPANQVIKQALECPANQVIKQA